MRGKQFSALLLITIIVVVLAFIALKQRKEAVTSDVEGQLLYPTLQQKINSIAAVQLASGDSHVNIENANNHWVVNEKDGYPANVLKIRETLLGLANLKIVERKTRNPDRYAKLGVEDPEGKDAGSTLLTLTDSDGATLAETIVGNSASGGPGGTNRLYVRKKDDAQSWLVEGRRLDISANAVQWLEKEIVNIDSKRISSVAIVQPDGAKVEIDKSKPDDKNFILVNLPKGKEPKSQASVNALASGLQMLNLEDVVKEDSVDLSKPVVTDFKTYDGLNIKSEAKKQDEKWYVKFTAAYDESLRKTPLTKEEKSDEQKEKEDKNSTGEDKSGTMNTKTPEEVQKEATDLSERFKGWVYVVPSNKAQNLTKKMDDLIKQPKADLEQKTQQHKTTPH